MTPRQPTPEAPRSIDNTPPRTHGSSNLFGGVYDYRQSIPGAIPRPVRRQPRPHRDAHAPLTYQIPDTTTWVILSGLAPRQLVRARSDPL
ncbi:hypothetical protein OG568_54190 (plasmid) [Streptomyces sp. NBC_01450]|uniref:hypothetical protein n=1 Tax=Streptomyces sp. NBC_01450 TaxID=2903871 RepID=UPI002E3625C1|nr:hypothetical protein [Streptomyces sp. NBC_01450]